MVVIEQEIQLRKCLSLLTAFSGLLTESPGQPHSRVLIYEIFFSNKTFYLAGGKCEAFQQNYLLNILY